MSLEFKKPEMAVGTGATVCYWTDREAYTIVKRTPRTLTLRKCKSTLHPDFKPVFVPGGFCGTVINQDEQRWIYEEDEKGTQAVAYWSERRGAFYVDGILRVIPGRHKFYDYNF